MIDPQPALKHSDSQCGAGIVEGTHPNLCRCKCHKMCKCGMLVGARIHHAEITHGYHVAEWDTPAMPSCGTYPYPVTKAPGDPVTGWFCAGSYCIEQADAEHQSEKMKEAWHSRDGYIAELQEKIATLESNPALTARQYYKGQALVAILSCWKDPFVKAKPDQVLELVTTYADGLTKEDREVEK